MPSIEDLEKEKVGEKHKLFEVKLTYDNPNIVLENYYFWLIDFVKYGLKLKIDKISDTFGASPGSSFLGEMSSRMMNLLNQARSLGALINDIVKAILSIIYEIKYIKQRLKLYDEYKKIKDPKASDKEKSRAHAALMSLKSIWIEKVDSQRGQASLSSLARSFKTTTVMDVFFACTYPEDVDDLVRRKVINERVARVVKPRLMEFWKWLEESEKELRSRYKLLVSYLKHEINSLFTYFEFARPLLRFARKLLMKEYSSPDVVSIFETAILELLLLIEGKEKEFNIIEKGEKKKKKYYPVIEIKLYFRIYPMGQRVGGSSVYTHIGKLDLEFYAYVLNEDELKDLRKKELERDLLYIEGMTKDTIENLLDDILKIFEDYEKETGKDIWKGLEWLKEFKKEKKEEKKEEKDKEEKKKKILENPLFDLVYAFIDIIKAIKDIFPKKREKVEGEEGEVVKEEKEEFDKFKRDTVDLCWKIYTTFKKNYGLLS